MDAWHRNVFFAEVPFSDQHQTASMKFDIHLLHFPWQNDAKTKKDKRTTKA